MTMQSRTDSEREIRRRKRVSNACQRCRKNKIKCSGTHPCSACSHRGYPCEFGPADKRVLVSESVLQDLRLRLSSYEQQQGAEGQPQRRSESVPEIVASNTISESVQDSATPSRQHEAQAAAEQSHCPTTPPSDHVAVANPLVHHQPLYISDNSGSLNYLGHSSTWSFSRQVLHMAHSSPHTSLTPSASLHVEGEVYRVDSERSRSWLPADTNGLPSVDIAQYYLQSVKFRTHSLYHLFDETDFTFHLYRFYDNPATYSQEHSLWYVHYLLIMAFGKAFVANAQFDKGPPGIDLFQRAVRLLPDITVLVRERVQSTEILCCIALYLASIDHRTAAHVYIGQAVRLAQSHGLHTNMQADTVGDQLVHRGHRIIWTVYALDRKLSCSMGVPNGLRDEDISAPLALKHATDVSTTALVIHVRICQLLGKVISTVYSPGEAVAQTYTSTAQTVLRGVAGLADDLATYSSRCFGDISRVAAHLSLAYHQCIILASRPFLYYLLKQRLGDSNLSRPFPLSPTTKGLVQVCIDSAMQTIMILSQLKGHDLLDTFLPFDLECAFSAAFALLMASSVHPKLLPQYSWFTTVMDVFDSISQKGNLLATLRKSEVDELAQILYGLDRGRFQPAITTPKQNQNITADEMQQFTFTPLSGGSSLPNLGDPFFDEWNAEEGFSAAQIMDLADALDLGGLDPVGCFL